MGDAKLFNIQVKTPNITNFSPKFSRAKGNIYFGVKDVKSLTGKTGDKVLVAVNELKDNLKKNIENFYWLEILIFLSKEINSTAFKALASVGFFRGFKDRVSRNRALYEYEIYKGLTKAEKAWVEENYKKKRWKTLKDCLIDLAPTKKEGGGTSRKNRSDLVMNEVFFLDNPPYDLSDDPSWVIEQEVKFLGCPVSMSRVESSDTSSANSSCKEIIDGKVGKNLSIAANITRLSDYTINKGKSKGKTMCFLTVEDESCSLDSVIIFPDCREKYQYLLYEGNNLLFNGSVSKQDNSFIVNTIFEI